MSSNSKDLRYYFIFSKFYSVCNICGISHHTENCNLLNDLKHVKDTPTIPRARLTIPSGLKVESLADGTTTVVACMKFDRGTHFGPFQANLTTDLHPGVSLPLKVCPFMPCRAIIGKSGNDGYYLDTTDEEICNWMCLVAPASTASEQNLICYDMKQSIYFTAIKDILPGEELKVWYALYYGLKLQALPLADNSDCEDDFMDLPNNDLESKLRSKTNVGQEIGHELLESLAQHLPAHSLGARMEKDRWQCRFCEKHESNVALYAKHLMSHYRPKCHFCGRRFYSEKALLKHQKNRHSSLEVIGDTQNQNNICQKRSISESGSFDAGERASEVGEEKETALISTTSWIENNVEMIESKKNNENRDSTKLSNEKNGMENYGNFCPLISVDKGNQEEFTLNNLDSSQVVQSQLVLAEDGSVVYHVANIPEGILATEMDKLGLLVVDNENKCPQIGETAGSWSDPTDELADSTLQSASSENTTLENRETLQNETEAYCIDGKVDLENECSVALILLNTVANENELEQLGNPKDEFNQRGDRNEQSEGLDADSQTMNDSMDATELEPAPKTNKSPFRCDICSKTFEKSAYLYRHLRKHTGEFTCVNCLAVFARKENLQSHPCTRPMVRHPCPICGKKFSAKKYLQRHIPLHTGEFTCEKCKRPFVSRVSLASHRCRTDETSSKDSIKCSLCEQVFADQLKLQAHLMHHSETDPDGNRMFLPSTQATRKLRKRKGSTKIPPENISISVHTDDAASNISGIPLDKLNHPATEENCATKDDSKAFICEICGSVFKSFSSMKTHRFLHGERRFECKICGKRFHRKDVLQEHITVHQSPQLPCLECGKKLKTKKSLEVHMMIHVGAKRFTCNDCGKEFYQKGNLIKHQRVHTPPADRTFSCQHCNKSFTSREYLSMHTLEHTQGKIFQCPNCSKSFVKKHLLDAHQQSTHSNRAFLCRYCNSFMRHRHSARRHLEQQHPDKQSEWAQQGFVDLMLAELPADSLLLNNGGILPGQQEIRQEELLSLRNRHFGTTLMEYKEAEMGEISANNQTSQDLNLTIENREVPSDINQKENNENQDLTMDEIATLTLQQQVELLTDPLLSNPQLQLDEINVIPVSFEEKKKGEEILLEVVEPQLQQTVVVHPNDTDTVVPASINTSDPSAFKGETAEVTIGGNTYILQDQVVFGEDEMSSGDIFLYVLDSGNQQ